MRKLFTMAVAFLVVACGGTSTENLTVASQMASARGGNSEWVLTTWEVPPGALEIPADCIGETFEYVGTIYFNDHIVTSGSRLGTHDNWEIWWDPGVWVSLTTGDRWVFGPGFNNHGVWWTDESGNPTAQTNHEFIPLQNERTGQTIKNVIKQQITLNALGEYKREFFSFGCVAKP
jgi:hypothetical protein